VTVTLPPTAHLAIVGPSGSGKSTFLQLLLGELEYEGDILVDGVNLKTLDPTWWREQMAWVTQRPYFFSGTIWDNLIRVAPRATPEEVEWALMEAGAWDFIQRLPMGWHTPIGQEGQMLSGGQRQRLALTRAFLLDRPIVLFDEPSQNLDLPTEAALMRGMERLRSGRTTITIAHRLLTVARADYVLVLNRGRVEQAGVPAELARVPGLYRSLVEAYEQRRDWNEPLQADPII
jgi:ABC-type multidrug transport system fused ATPase/permease subunit